MRRNEFLRVPVMLAVCVALAMALPVVMGGQEAPTYRPVTDERLENPDPGDWLMYRRTYDSWGYSPLDQITTDNVANLEPVWTFSTGVTSGHQAPPIVNDGIMFVTTPESQVLAIDVRTGDLLWRYRRELPEDIVRGHRTNRGVGLYDDKVFVTTQDAFVVALNATTGELVWEQDVRGLPRTATT